MIFTKPTQAAKCSMKNSTETAPFWEIQLPVSQCMKLGKTIGGKAAEIDGLRWSCPKAPWYMPHATWEMGRVTTCRAGNDPGCDMRLCGVWSALAEQHKEIGTVLPHPKLLFLARF